MKNRVAIFGAIAFALLTWGLYEALVGAPTEQTMGEVQRIFYYHVPSAWTAFLLFMINCGASIWYIAKRGAKADALALATAEVGLVFCTVVLITGPIWAKPVWGIWWTWDARLTSTLILWLIYVAYLMLRKFSTGGQTPLVAAVLAVFGFLDVPLVYWSIRIFRTQHPQPVIAGGQGSGIHPTMLKALMINWLAFMVFGAIVVSLRYVLERNKQNLNEAFALREERAHHVEVSR
jgi:heme exporter protein C